MKTLETLDLRHLLTNYFISEGDIQGLAVAWNEKRGLLPDQRPFRVVSYKLRNEKDDLGKREIIFYLTLDILGERVKVKVQGDQLGSLDVVLVAYKDVLSQRFPCLGKVAMSIFDLKPQPTLGGEVSVFTYFSDEKTQPLCIAQGVDTDIIEAAVKSCEQAFTWYILGHNIWNHQ